MVFMNKFDLEHVRSLYFSIIYMEGIMQVTDRLLKRDVLNDSRGDDGGLMEWDGVMRGVKKYNNKNNHMCR